MYQTSKSSSASYVKTGIEIKGPLHGQTEAISEAVRAMKSKVMKRIEADIEKVTDARQKAFVKIQAAAAARTAETVKGIETDVSDIEMEKPLTDSELATLEDFNETIHKLNVKLAAASIEFYQSEIDLINEARQPMEKALANAKNEVARIEQDLEVERFKQKTLKGLLDMNQAKTHVYQPVIDIHSSREKQRRLGVI